MRLRAILETVLYYDGAVEKDVERFYSEVLGLRQVSRFGDGMVFRLGEGLLLLFDEGKTSSRQDVSARHGAVGSVHTCFRVSPEEYDRWKEALPAENEVTWKNGVRSFYFRDPADNLLELAEGDLWPE